MEIFSFFQHQAPLKKFWDDDITYPSCIVVTSLCSRVVDDFSACGLSRHSFILLMFLTNF
jgi:hypothetical protein